MRLNGLDLNLIVALEAILRLRSVTAAAKEIYLTQSAISHSLARLREHFADDIVTQIGRDLVPTPFGERLGSVAKALLSEAQVFSQMRANFDPATAEREFTISCSDYVTTVFISVVARRLAVIAPGISLRCLSVGGLSEEKFLRGEIDFLVGPAHILNPDFPSLELYSDTFRVVVDADNPLIGDSLDLEQYLSMRHVVTIFGTDQERSHLEQFMADQNHHMKMALCVPMFSVIPAAIVGTPFIGTLHARLLSALPADFPLRILEPPIEVPPLVEYISWHPNRDHDLAAVWLIGVFGEVAKAMGPPPSL